MTSMSLFRCASQNVNCCSARHALTLLELIVALGILAVLSTIAVTSLDPLADQARYQASVQLLEQLTEATVGHPSDRQPGGERLERTVCAVRPRPNLAGRWLGTSTFGRPRWR